MARRFLRDVRRGPMMRTPQSGPETLSVVAGQSPDRRRTPVEALASGLALCLLVSQSYRASRLHRRRRLHRLLVVPPAVTVSWASATPVPGYRTRSAAS